ncbi:MAG TPA: alpha/beta hydrolase [Gemmatimonadales bacterium]|jgi:hypothetical protein
MRAGIVVALAVAGYYAFLFLIQRRLLYPGPRGAWAGAMGPDARRITIPVTGGTAVAFFLPPARPTARFPVIIFMHGNAERGEDWLAPFRPVRDSGVGVMIVEYPGYGEAPGSSSEASITQSALAAYDWVRARPDVDGERIVSWGRSLGGGAATRLATRRPVRALILESSFTSLRWFAKSVLAPGFLVRDPFDNLNELAHYHGPLLVLHGADDETIPFAHGRALAAVVAGARFVSMPCGHNDCARPYEPVFAFLRNGGVLAAASDNQAPQSRRVHGASPPASHDRPR